MYMCMYTYTYMYIYIERERKIERERDVDVDDQMYSTYIMYNLMSLCLHTHHNFNVHYTYTVYSMFILGITRQTLLYRRQAL